VLAALTRVQAVVTAAREATARVIHVLAALLVAAVLVDILATGAREEMAT
jgi:hypothetical protein